MKIVGFRGYGVHGYLKYDLAFQPSLNFITGTNGSGKTTALNAIQGLLSPDLYLLANLDYDHISVDLVDDRGLLIAISSTNVEGRISISCSVEPGEFSFNKFVTDVEAQTLRQMEQESDYYREVFS